MIARRLQTRETPELSGRTYRFIAFSFLAIILVLGGVIVFAAFKKTEIIILAKEDAKTVNFVVNAEKQKGAERSLVALVTSTKFSWQENFHATAMKKVDGTARGEATIYNKTNEEQTLVKTTRLLTPDGVLFRLSERVTIPAGGQVTAPVYADQAGAKSDIGPSQFTIPGLSQERQKFVYAENLKPMSGGTGEAGVISETDLAAAKNEFLEKAKTAFLDKFSPAKYGNFNAVAVTVSDNKAVASSQAGDEVSEFTVSGDITLTLVLYRQEEMNELVGKEVDKGIDNAAEKILSAKPEPRVEIAAADLANASAQLAVAAETLVTLDANAPLLAKENFVGRSKSELERYIVSLPHVSGMSIKFTPSWANKTPGSADKIKIVVKNVE